MTKVKLSTVLTELFERAGAGELSGAEDITIEISEETSNALLTGLLSKSKVRHDPDLQKHYVGKFLTGTFENAKKLLKDKGFTDEEITFLDDPKLVYKDKQEIMIDMVAKKSAPTGKGDSKALQDEITALNSQLADIKKTHIPKADFDKHISDTNQKLYQNAVNGLANKIKWSEQEASKSEALRIAQFNTALQIELNEAGAVAVLDENGALVLRNAKDNTMEYFDKQNKKPNIETFINELALKNKFISVSGGDNTNNSSNQNGATVILTSTQRGDANKKPTSFQSQLEQRLNSMPKIDD